MAITEFLLAAAAAAPGAAKESPYGLVQALKEGGAISITTFVILVIMSIGTFYILFTKFLQQQKIINQGKKVRASFWNSANLREASGKLDAKSAYRSIVEDALVAQDQHSKLTDPVDQHEWVAGSLARSQGGIAARLGEGLAFLATVGSTAPFIGLFGTVVGIYRALIKIGSSGQASIDTVAGPVGEALIMTALGLIVAVPAVLAYNWLITQQDGHRRSVGFHQRRPRLPCVEWRGEAGDARRDQGPCPDQVGRSADAARQRAAPSGPDLDWRPGCPGNRAVDRPRRLMTDRPADA